MNERNVFQPDLTFVSNERAKQILVPEGGRGAPDLVAEILSPSTAALARQKKRVVYARAGVAELWVTDPEVRQVSLYDLAADPEHPAVVFQKTDILTTPQLPGLRLLLAEIFA